MNKSKIYEWEILVPQASNDGQLYSIDYHSVWDEKIRKISKGLTIYRSAKGVWVNNDTVQQERMIPVRFCATRKQLDWIMKFTAFHYQQKAVKAALISKEVLIKMYDPSKLAQEIFLTVEV